MTSPVINRVDLDAEPVDTRNGARGESRGQEGGRSARRYDGTDAPAGADGAKTPSGNGDLDQRELEKGEEKLDRVIGW